MRTNTLRELLDSGAVAVGGWLSVDSRYLAEVLSYGGYDTVTVDLQHGMFGLGEAVHLLQAVSAGPATPLARCPSHDPAVIGKLLDAGAYGIICPAVDSAADAAAFVRACRYPPSGIRSFGPSRGLLYGGADYAEHADETVLTFAMIESAAALADLEAIVATPGLDGVYVGPNDLALSLGVAPGAPTGVVLEALERIAAVATAAGVWPGTFCADAVVARQMVELGYRLVTPGNDIGILRTAVADRVAAVRGHRSTDAERGDATGY
ncbi:MAG: HpcH/HpaI aldolase family protein [Jatrophihabitans sp.]|uniref:HpcH/HpaI aldolase family protein n=1 Tax=Jatrophihabitans sp. TaxID=1932789 RepID=UPI003F81DB0F